MSLKTRILSFVFICLFASFLSANTDDLLEQSSRPTIADVEKKVNSESDVLTSIGNLSYSAQTIAILIAELEWAYPGAIYMPLGRDTVYIGDYMDAFYRSQGQPGRVIRLNASGPSLEFPSEMIARFIQSSGVDIKNLKDGPTYVFFDGSSYRLPDISQSAKILTAVYREYVRQGGKPTDLLTKFAFFNTFQWGGGAVVVNRNVDREEFLQRQYEYLEKNPDSIPQEAFASTAAPSGGSEWHESFELLKEQPNGLVLANPGPLNPTITRKSVLAQMKIMIEEVRNPKFLEKVQERAKELGYEFKFQNNVCDSALETNNGNKD